MISLWVTKKSTDTSMYVHMNDSSGAFKVLLSNKIISRLFREVFATPEVT